MTQAGKPTIHPLHPIWRYLCIALGNHSKDIAKGMPMIFTVKIARGALQRIPRGILLNDIQQVAEGLGELAKTIEPFPLQCWIRGQPSRRSCARFTYLTNIMCVCVATDRRHSTSASFFVGRARYVCRVVCWL